MQTDTLLSALSVMRQRLMQVGGVYTAEQTQDRLRIIGSMRDNVLTEVPSNFTDYCQHALAGMEGDLMVDILEELHEELGVEDMMWDTLEERFLQPN